MRAVKATDDSPHSTRPRERLRGLGGQGYALAEKALLGREEEADRKH